MRRLSTLYKVTQKAIPFFMIWVSLVLMYGVICAYTDEFGRDEFYRFIFFLRAPLVLIINFLAFIAILLHTGRQLYQFILLIKGDHGGLVNPHFHTEQTKNTQKEMPVINSLVKAGGIWAALFSPVIIVITTLIIPFGKAPVLSYLLKLHDQISGKLFLLLMISLPIWFALHQIVTWLNEINLYPKRRKSFIYLVAIAWTLHTVYILFFR